MRQQNRFTKQINTHVQIGLSATISLLWVVAFAAALAPLFTGSI